MDKLERLMPYELAPPEVTLYHEAVATDDHGGGVEFVSQCVMAGTMELWVYNEMEDTRIEEPLAPILVVVTRIVDFPDGHRDLLIQMMAGRNITATDSHTIIHEHLINYAKQQGALRLSAMVKPEIFDHFEEVLNGVYKKEFVVITLPCYPPLEDT